MSEISFSYNDSDPHSCFFTTPGKIFFSTSSVTHVVFLLPPCLFILSVGFQQPQQKRPASSAPTVSHCDVFTYHMVTMELIGALGNVIASSGSCMENLTIFLVGLGMFSFTWYGEIFFHTVTCVERYLAVVHPITYLGLKTEIGIRIRNVCTGCVWLLCFGGSSTVIAGNYIVLDFCLLVSSTIVISICTVSVLCVLNRAGPGKQGREKADQSKQKAFYTIVAILGILMLRLCFGLIWACLDFSGHTAHCMVMLFCMYINLPSSLVLPLLFLHRRGKLLCCKSRLKQPD